MKSNLCYTTPLLVVWQEAHAPIGGAFSRYLYEVTAAVGALHKDERIQGHKWLKHKHTNSQTYFEYAPTGLQDLPQAPGAFSTQAIVPKTCWIATILRFIHITENRKREGERGQREIRRERGEIKREARQRKKEGRKGKE